ncbi:adenylate/guanylate cyclase domain-containing protein [Bradyrhizobium erythrophlei]|jgi:adenylate cyclase|uniref:Adenylate cyclase n=1 Tax=Bradyrhizobium erythrophlei TaxID=1437360 RepID=A0A1M7UJC5_9BRAD|nr:adenylate/guanylate cyclase domain-containing protein [Bradyrhizobium erythrophlei]SHN83036.1 adenylate cyclase [Bradyrhizobium erythrophlei]
MRGLWRDLNIRLNSAKPSTEVSPEFQHALMRQILKTELARTTGVIGFTLVLASTSSALFFVSPAEVEHIWHGRLYPLYIWAVIGPFIAFEFGILYLVKRRIALDQDIPVLRRYIGTFIETSLPTLLLAIHIDRMGATEALGFAAPLVYFLFIVLSTLRLDFWLPVFTGLVAAVELFAMAMLYHPALPRDVVYHLLRSLVILICGLLAGAVALRVRRQFEASIAAASARDRVTNLFGQHVSPPVVERLLREGAATTSELRRVVVMFVDFRSFTVQAQQRSPREVVERLDRAFAVLVEILDRHGGIVNKFLGDGLLALFGAPIAHDDAVRQAVDAARDMLAAMERDNAAGDWALRIGIGVHVGEVVAGTIGSPRRKEYTVIGDAVNLASRLEALNKELGTQCLISAAVYDALGETGRDAVPLGEMKVRGYERPVAVWRLG